ncbi:MAG: hypothetical protein ACLRZ7_09545, partial [Lachnospiraceae bacterium]
MNKNNRNKKIFSYFLLVVGAFIFILPYLYMMVASTQSNAQILGGGVNFKIGSSFMDNLEWLLERFDYPRVIINSIIIAVISTILGTASATMAGYALA